jgi:uncharacterized protein YoxC
LDATTSIFLNISIVIQIVVFISLIYLVVTLTKIIKGLTEKVENLQKDFDGFKTKVDPAVEEALVLLKKVNKVADKIDDNIVTIKSAVDKVKDTSSEIMDFALNVKRRVEPSIIDSVNSFNAFSKGVRVFFDRLKLKRDLAEKPEENFLFDEHIENNNDNTIDFESEFTDINKELNEVRKKLEEMKKV